MATYLDILPKELTEIVLHYLDNDKDIEENTNLINDALDGTGIPSLDIILHSSSFWNNHVRLSYPYTPFKYLPQYLYDFTGQDIVSVVSNFKRFKSVYYNALYTFRCFIINLTVRTFLDIRPNNFQVLTDILRKYITSDRELYNIFNAYSIHLVYKNGFKLKNGESLYFNISKEEAFALILDDYWNVKC
jgi:hypothetical protein